MAKIKSLRMKNKTHIFTSYENDKDKNPAKVIFHRFPLPSETFTPIDKKSIFQGIDLNKITEEETRLKIAENLVDNFTENLIKGNTDYKAFIEECVDCFENLEYEQSKIVTVKDFWQILPQEAAETIARELYEYASQRDEFTMGELKA